MVDNFEIDRRCEIILLYDVALLWHFIVDIDFLYMAFIRLFIIDYILFMALVYRHKALHYSVRLHNSLKTNVFSNLV